MVNYRTIILAAVAYIFWTLLWWNDLALWNLYAYYVPAFVAGCGIIALMILGVGNTRTKGWIWNYFK